MQASAIMERFEFGHHQSSLAVSWIEKGFCTHAEKGVAAKRHVRKNTRSPVNKIYSR